MLGLLPVVGLVIFITLSSQAQEPRPGSDLNKRELENKLPSLLDETLSSAKMARDDKCQPDLSRALTDVRASGRYTSPNREWTLVEKPDGFMVVLDKDQKEVFRFEHRWVHEYTVSTIKIQADEKGNGILVELRNDLNRIGRRVGDAFRSHSPKTETGEFSSRPSDVFFSPDSLTAVIYYKNGGAKVIDLNRVKVEKEKALVHVERGVWWGDKAEGSSRSERIMDARFRSGQSGREVLLHNYRGNTVIQAAVVDVGSGQVRGLPFLMSESTKIDFVPGLKRYVSLFKHGGMSMTDYSTDKAKIENLFVWDHVQDLIWLADDDKPSLAVLARKENKRRDSKAFLSVWDPLDPKKLVHELPLEEPFRSATLHGKGNRIEVRVVESGNFFFNTEFRTEYYEIDEQGQLRKTDRH